MRTLPEHLREPVAKLLSASFADIGFKPEGPNEAHLIYLGLTSRERACINPAQFAALVNWLEGK